MMANQRGCVIATRPGAYRISLNKESGPQLRLVSLNEELYLFNAVNEESGEARREALDGLEC